MDSIFSTKRALVCANLSELAYEDLENTSQLKAKLKLLDFELVGTISNSVTDTQCYIAKCDEFAILCFRGTQGNYLDILTDLTARMILDVPGKMHNGFLSAFKSVSSNIIVELEKINIPIISTGHSLGGALAKIAILYFPHKIVACYTFGSPAICDKLRVNGFETPVFRIINEADIVARILELSLWFVIPVRILFQMVNKIIKDSKLTKLIENLMTLEPDLTSYFHFGKSYYLKSNGELKVGDEKISSLRIMYTYAVKGWKRLFEDHRISAYVAGIFLVHIEQPESSYTEDELSNLSAVSKLSSKEITSDLK